MTTPKRARAFMVQGVGTNVGKSLIVAGLCRLAWRNGIRVAPFKPQNMSNNAAVTPDGGEIGRAQALQAQAAGLAPRREMNPVLLKPEHDKGSQVIVLGSRYGQVKGRAYRNLKAQLLPEVIKAYDVLAAEHDLIIVEGAGSAAEVNLQAADFANMGFADSADLDVLLVGDIDRGGVIASLIGTREVLSAAHRARIKGFVVNKFRGEPDLFVDGMTYIEEKTGWPALGLLPWFEGAHHLPAEDQVDLKRMKNSRDSHQNKPIRVGVPLYPRMANFDDLDPLRQEAGVDLIMVEAGNPLPLDLDLVILPGSKAVQGDLAFFRHQGWHIDLMALARRGASILGLCGGYQMLGQTISDPEGLESSCPESDGLGLLAVDTILTPHKALKEVRGQAQCGEESYEVSGYEMHMGITKGADCARPFLTLSDGRPEGAKSESGLIIGTYVHGLFAEDKFRSAFLSAPEALIEGLNYRQGVEKRLNDLADLLESSAPLLKKHPWLGIPEK